MGNRGRAPAACARLPDRGRGGARGPGRPRSGVRSRRARGRVAGGSRAPRGPGPRPDPAPRGRRCHRRDPRLLAPWRACRRGAARRRPDARGSRVGGGRRFRRLPSSGGLTATGELLVGRDAPPRARVPREALERALSGVAPEAGGKGPIAQDPLERVVQPADVAGLDQEPRDSVLDDLGQAADPAAHDRGAARHRLECREAQQFHDRDPAAVAGHVHRGQRDHRGALVEPGQLVLRDGAGEPRPSTGQVMKQVRVVALGCVAVMAGGADDGEVDIRRQRPDQAIDALVRRNPPDAQHPAAPLPGIGAEAVAVDASVDHAGARARRAQLARGILGHHEEALEERQQRASQGAAGQPVVGRDRGPPARPRDERRHAAGRAVGVVRVHDIRAGHRRGQPRCERVSGVAQLEDRSQHPHAQPARLSYGGARSERDELAVDVAREGTSELERIALAAPEDPGVAERRGRDVDDPHLVLCMVTLGDPRRLTGGYLYHLRMADAAQGHGARIVFLSFPERTFPLPALAAWRVFERARVLGADAILLDSIAAAFAGPLLALRRASVPVIGVLHQPPGGIDHGRIRTGMQAPLDRLAYRDARLLIVASELLADQLTAAGVDPQRLRVVPPGRDVATPRDERPDLRAGRRAAVLCVGNWVRRKGILELLEAFARLPFDAATLHLAGDEQGEPAYARRVNERLARDDLSERVIRHGAVSREAVATLYASADVFVLPAFREPYGTVWGEAMAFGLPVVGWRAGNLPYLADDGREGLLVAPGDIDGLARALQVLAEDPSLRDRLGQAARRRASARPTWEQAAAQFFAAVRQGLASPET